MTYNNPWIYQDKEFHPEDIDTHLGFVYIIVNTLTDKKYIGRKLFWSHKYSQKKNKVTGKIRRKKIKIESNWREYYGSNELLNEHVIAEGAEKFTREILKLCMTKSEMSYWETKLQFENDVLLKNEYYNSWVTCKITKKHLAKMILD